MQANSGRKLFYGLFIFPLLIAVGMALLLCGVVLLTHEEESAESLITAIKIGSPSKRWQKAFELSNELNQKKDSLRSEGLMREIASVLGDGGRYDARTRGYMALALGYFDNKESKDALKNALADPSEDVLIYALWSLGKLKAGDSAPQVRVFLKSDSAQLRKTSAYVLGVMEDRESAAELRLLLTDPVMDVQWNAALSLARLGDDSGLDVLLRMVERNAFSAQAVSDEAIETVMLNAVRGLALLRHPKSLEVLEALSRGDKSLKVRQAALKALEYQTHART